MGLKHHVMLSTQVPTINMSQGANNSHVRKSTNIIGQYEAT